MTGERLPTKWGHSDIAHKGHDAWPLRCLALLLLMHAGGRAQEQPAATVMENSGKPMVVPPRCVEEDLQWAGLACSEDEPCPMYLEITAVQAAGTRIFAAGNIHTSSATLYSELLGSDDDGRTWSEAHDAYRGSALDRIEFADSETGWVVGQSLYPLVQDPFLLVTSDGGKSWRRQPVFGESRPGSIVDFGFTSKSQGSLVFDRGPTGGHARYESYESQDGGATWALTTATNTPPQTKAGEASAVLRVRTDGPAQAFLIEKRAGDRWTPAASFAVKLGSCGEANTPGPR